LEGNELGLFSVLSQHLARVTEETNVIHSAEVLTNQPRHSSVSSFLHTFINKTLPSTVGIEPGTLRILITRTPVWAKFKKHIKIYVGIMTRGHLKKRLESTHEASCSSIITQHIITYMNTRHINYIYTYTNASHTYVYIHMNNI